MKSQKTYTVDQATLLLERYCIYQDRCHYEIEKKLDSLNLITEAKEIIIIHLIQQNYLNEERFAKSYVRGKFYYKNWGKAKITTKLKFKNISAYNIKTGLKEINQTDYNETILKLINKKLKTLNEKNIFTKKKKILNFMLQKGFTYSDIIKPINELCEAD